jgi:hypothetical protein
MKFRLSPVVSFLIILLVPGCERTSDTTNQFITDFLNQKSVQVYKSEIQRTRVNFFPKSKTLVYSFWKKEIFNKNGDLFLHLYLKDSALLPESRKEHGFINLSIKNEDILVMDSLNFYMLKDLSSYGELDSFSTGQYIGTKRTWYAKHQIKSAPQKNTEIVKNKLSIPNNAKGQIAVPANKMSFINHLVVTDAIPIFNEKNALNIFLSQESLEMYLTFNLEAEFFKYKYSLSFFEEMEGGLALDQIPLFNQNTLNLNLANNKVSAVKIKVPKQAKRMALLREESGKPTVLFSTYID